MPDDHDTDTDVTPPLGSRIVSSTTFPGGALLPTPRSASRIETTGTAATGAWYDREAQR